jgi:hypothetical protein
LVPVRRWLKILSCSPHSISPRTHEAGTPEQVVVALWKLHQTTALLCEVILSSVDCLSVISRSLRLLVADLCELCPCASHGVSAPALGVPTVPAAPTAVAYGYDRSTGSYHTQHQHGDSARICGVRPP